MFDILPLLDVVLCPNGKFYPNFDNLGLPAVKTNKLNT